MESEIRNFENGSDGNQSYSGSGFNPGRTFEPWQTPLVLWLPHASISLLLVALVLLSFVRFHTKHGHKYRKSSKGPRPAWQELGMHDFIRQIHSTAAAPSGLTGLTDTEGVDGGGPASQSNPDISSLRLPSPSSLDITHPVGSVRPVLFRYSGARPTPPLTPLSSIVSAQTPRISIASSSDAEVTSQSNTDVITLQDSSSSSANVIGLPSAQRVVIVTSESSGSWQTTANGADVTAVKSETEMTSPEVVSQLPPKEGQDTGSGPTDQSSSPAVDSSQKSSSNAAIKRPLFVWTLGTDRVGDSTEKDLNPAPGAPPRIPPRIWMTMDRNRGSEVVLRSTGGPLRAITAVSLSKQSSEDEQKLIERSPM